MAPDLKPISVFLDSSRELRARYLAEAPFGGVVVEVDGSVREEDLVELRLAFGDSQERFALRGLVLWCRQAEGTRRTAGVGFLASEADVRERMIRHAAGERLPAGVDVERKDPRYETTLKVSYETATDFVLDYTRNISSGGLFVASPRPPEVGATILFRVFPPGESQPLELSGQVAWRRAGQGFGVRFVGLGDTCRARLDSLVKRVAVRSPTPPRPPRHEGLSA